MLNVIKARIQQGYRTVTFPATTPELPDRFRGMPVIDHKKCAGSSCTDCMKVCPTGAIEHRETVTIDTGKCLFCTACSDACTAKSLSFSRNHQLASGTRDGLVVDGSGASGNVAVSKEIKRVFGRSLSLRQVSAGGCNACEADINVLTTVGWDLGQYGIQIVASPRHADGLIVTGPVTENMKIALEKTYRATPAPKIVIALGSCAISGGPFVDCKAHHHGIGNIIPVDLFIPGCPPHPATILDALLRFTGRF